MGLTGMLFPLALVLFVAAAALLALGLRGGNTIMTIAAVALFVLLAAGYALLLSFITAM